jgi:general stress protein 26
MTFADPVVAHLLERAMFARLATMSRSRRPDVNPNYFVVDGSRLWLGTTTATLAARNVAANPSVQILLEDESNPEARELIRISGSAKLRTEPAVLKQYKWRDVSKYFRLWKALLMSVRHLRRLFLTSQYHSTDEPGLRHCVIEVEPARIEILERIPRP